MQKCDLPNVLETNTYLLQICGNFLVSARVEEADGAPNIRDPPCASNAADVLCKVFRIIGQIVVHHEIESCEIMAACTHIGRDENVLLRSLEVLVSLLTLVLVVITEKWYRVSG